MATYPCSSADCAAKKYQQTGKDGTKEEPFMPFRLLVCGHSVCDLCVLTLCQKQNFIKCSICSFNTTINDTIQKNIVQSEPEIKRWIDPSSVIAPEVIRFDTTLFPLDIFQIGSGVLSGVLSATKTAEMIDLDLDDESQPITQSTANLSLVNSLFEDDAIVKNVIPRIPKTAPIDFQQTIENSVKTFADLSQNHTAVKRVSDETKDWFKKIKSNTTKMFHRLHSVLQIREKEVLDEIESTEQNRQIELKVIMNEILSKRGDLKGKILQSSQLQTDKDRIVLKRAIDRLLKDSTITTLEPPQNEFKFCYETSIENHLKKFGKVERTTTSSQSGLNSVSDMDEDIIEEVNCANEKPSQNGMVDVSSDEEEMEMDVSKSNYNIDKEVVTILQAANPSKFYVQKSSDRERFDILQEEINKICQSAFLHPPAWDTLKEGESLFAYSVIKQRWCRSTLTLFRKETDPKSHEEKYLADIVLIDYGISETVPWYNVREKKIELFDVRKWPPFAYKCSLYGVKPNRKTGSNWSQFALDLFNQYIKEIQLILIELEAKDGVKFVDLIHYDVPGVTYQIPSLIEVLVKNEAAWEVTSHDFESYSKYKAQPLRYVMPEMPRIMRTTSVLVSHVETPDLFYVQLQRTYQQLLKMIEEMNAYYTEQNAGIYTYYCPKLNTPCAAVYEGDGQYYRASIIKKGKTPTEWVVAFVDFGNTQSCKYSEIRLLKNHLMEMPIQSIPCGLIHIDPINGYKWPDEATKKFKFIISNDRGPQILTMVPYETKNFNENQHKLLVVLRSFDGDNGIKVNEQMVKEKQAISTGPHSQPDPKGDKSMYSSMESLNSVASSSSRTTDRSQVVVKSASAFVIIKEMMERNERAAVDVRDSLIKVKVTHLKSPDEFYVQIDGTYVNNLFEQIQTQLYNTYSKSLHMFTGDINFKEDDWCAFKLDNKWRRGKVLARIQQLTNVAPEEPQYTVLDIDYGGQHEVKVSTMRRLNQELQFHGHLAVKCGLYSIKPSGGDRWTNSAKDEFKEFADNAKKEEHELFILPKGNVDKEPVSVILYSCQCVVAGPFTRSKNVYTSANSFLVDKGLALYQRSGGDSNEIETCNEELNNETTPRKSRVSLPFSMVNNDGILENLEQRFGTDLPPVQNHKPFQYQEARYPTVKEFYGIPTDLKIHPKEFNIAFRFFEDRPGDQPIDWINKQITQTLQEKGELPQFSGNYKKGDACTCYFDFDKTWNRAEIIGVTPDQDDTELKLLVRFVDYDNQEKVLMEKLSSHVFALEIPKLALNCQLINIKPNSDESRDQVRNHIYTKVLDKKCRFVWENFPNKPMRVTVHIPDESDNYQPFIDFLYEQELLASDRKEDNEKMDLIMDLIPQINQTFGLYPIVFKIDKFYNVVMSQFIGPNYGFFQVTDKRCPVGEEKIINDEHERFLQMIEIMATEVDSYPRLSDISEGRHCIAKYVDDCWYRGIIVETYPDDRLADVFFVDYGNTDKIAFTDLRELPKKLMKPKAHAFICEIHNIKPPNGLWSRNKDLPKRIEDHLVQFSADDKRMFARFKNNKYPLKIDLYLFGGKNQTSPDRHVFQEFVDKGWLEFCDSRDVYHKPVPTTQSYKSFRNVNNNIKTEPNN